MKITERLPLRTVFRGAGTIGIALGIVCLEACSSQSTPVKPEMYVSPTSYDYHTAQQLAAYIGTSQQASISIENRGTDQLTGITVTLSDKNGVFTLIQPSPATLGDAGPVAQTTLDTYPQETGYASFYFQPKAAQEYHATITITSNSATCNAGPDGGIVSGGTVTIPILAKGVNPPDGG